MSNLNEIDVKLNIKKNDKLMIRTKANHVVVISMNFTRTLNLKITLKYAIFENFREIGLINTFRLLSKYLIRPTFYQIRVQPC